VATTLDEWAVPMTKAQIEGLDWEGLAPAREFDRPEVAREKGYVKAKDGTDLFWYGWRGEGRRRGRVAIMHGYGEHAGRYAHVAAALVEAGYDVAALDARGHGKSGGPDAHVDTYDDYVDDLVVFIDDVLEGWGDAPLFVLGHSNGGLITLRYALRRPRKVTAFAVTSPMCAVAVKVPAWKSTAGRIMSRLWPTFAMPNDIPASLLTHDEHVCEVYAKDPLNRSVATSRWFVEMQIAQRDLVERAGLIKQPMFFAIGGSDQIVDPDAAVRVYHKLGGPDRDHEIYDDLYHEILNELEWKEVLGRILGWFEQQRADALGLYVQGEEE
jgi:lysophospholipase